MRGMSNRARLGWILALAIGWLAFMAIVAAQPTFGAHPESRVHYYLIAFACTEDRLGCYRLPTDEFSTSGKCLEHLTAIKENQDLYGIPGRPLVLGKCISWSPPLPNIPVPAPGETI